MFKSAMICTANVCRSPAAELLLKNELSLYRNVFVESYGIDAVFGKPIYQPMKELLELKGILGADKHRSRQLLSVKNLDIVLCMERDHVNWVCSLDPLAVNKVKLFGQWSDASDVEDPLSGKVTVKDVYEMLEKMALQWKSKIDLLGLT